MENGESRLVALREFFEDLLGTMHTNVNLSMARIGRDMQEAFSRIEWLENEAAALRRRLEVVECGKKGS